MYENLWGEKGVRFVRIYTSGLFPDNPDRVFSTQFFIRQRRLKCGLRRAVRKRRRLIRRFRVSRKGKWGNLQRTIAESRAPSFGGESHSQVLNGLAVNNFVFSRAACI
jgi:hypothetical protein